MGLEAFLSLNVAGNPDTNVGFIVYDAYRRVDIDDVPVDVGSNGEISKLGFSQRFSTSFSKVFFPVSRLWKCSSLFSKE